MRFVPTPINVFDPGSPSVAAAAQRGRPAAGELAGSLIGHAAAADARDSLLATGALAVTTGQQAGLFTGPLYTIGKALTAAALAEALAARWGRRVVPVFWVAGDDHDFAEINHCVVPGTDGAPVRVELRERAAEAAMLPAYREPLGTEVRRALDQLAGTLPPSPERDRTLDWLEGSYTPERSLAEACAVALAELLGRFGVVVARGWTGDVKRTARGVLLEAARRAAELDAALADAARALRAAAQEAPITVGEGLTLLMVEGRLGRDRLRLDGAGFRTRRSGEVFALADLERLLDTEPERLSGNVLLRPALEAAVFPTVGYIGGPGELGYLRQTGPVFRILDVPRPARLPRLSGFLVDHKTDKVLERHGLSPSDFAASEGELVSRVVRETLPRGAADALAELRAALHERYAALRAEARAIDPTLERTVENARNQALLVSQEIEKKLIAALKRHGEQALQQFVRARHALFPNGQPQERVLSLAGFLGRYGDSVLDVLAESARAHVRALLDGLPEEV